MGRRRIAIDLYRHAGELEELLNLLERKREEVCRIMADSPAEIIGIGRSCKFGPVLFEKYDLLFYQKCVQMFHEKGRIVMAHMDGMLANVKDVILKTGVDVVEAFTPPPQGDLSLHEAQNAWGDEIIISVNFPGSLCYFGVEAVEKYTLEIQKTVAPADNFMMCITEDMPPGFLEQTLKAITKVMWKYGKCPIEP